MDTKQYCANLSLELQRWRDAIHKENEIISKMSSADKLPMQAFVEDLRMLEAEMDERITQLKTQCPAFWGPENAESVMEPGGVLTGFDYNPDDSDGIIGGGNFGG
ncbi:hypothetical protein [Desulfoluna butyratoxydans]|uniref:Uncharacterized protein n=1 Tax=Desulfoluna butyratoxydans TaxID=231438 RepID=A0A4U8YWN2_9BACT|nr:hypothetical protein [Desulfoluna butyratoxydans]VFQ45843.1 hypothetical protein MSL71_35050 [Desulfoluna butyratoxydans]